MGCCNRKSSDIHPAEESSSRQSVPGENPPANSRKRSQKIPEIEQPRSNNILVDNQAKSSWSQSSTQSIAQPLPREYFQEPSHFTSNVINVLFLGESGVGKSTFINALVNYLTFDTLEQARSGQPIALMPVSFLMTEGEKFEERIILFGSKDPNENHNQSGQSVTQQCKSYVFPVGTQHKLNLIDTPGMGDTRGLDQDNRNMQQILSHINNLPHLNAICILLKPNESKLNVVFRTYFSQLINFLGEHVRQNIVFCFTNTRATFFTPGDTAPLLRQMLGDLPISNIPFEKSNTFCFDSESFRYLVARKNGIKFDDKENKEYSDSWASSVNESNRFLQYICSELKPYPQRNWQSIEHAQFGINRILRPILETIRNILRNSILITEKSLKPQIQLRLTAVSSSSSTICNQCKSAPQPYSDFWILPDELHIYLDKCARCSCSRGRHKDVSYQLDYDLLNDANKESIEELNENLDQLKQATVEFGCFFLRVSHTAEPNNDPVFSFLNQMIEEEDQICQEKGSECFNSRLLRKLNQFREEYEQRRSTLMSKRDTIDLPSIYELIQNVNGMNLIRKQMNVTNDNS